MERDSLIIVSGGVDSVTLLYERAASMAIGVSFDYGSNHNARERKEAFAFAGINDLTEYE